MLAVGMLLIWGGWSVSFWGYSLVRGYNVTFIQLVNPVHPYSGPWPPGPIPDTQVFPSGASGQGHPQVPYGSAVGTSIAQGVQTAVGNLKKKAK